jgi:phosphate acyltransferase
VIAPPAASPSPAAPAVIIAVDAEGGDNAPRAIVEGALRAASAQIHVLLVGRAARLRELVGGAPYAEIVDAAEVIGSGDEPARAVRDKPQSSMMVAARLVAEGRADAFYSAGNTGACLAAGLLTVRRLKGVLRPAICVVLPSQPRPTVLLDAGANAEVQPAHLRQFAVLGRAFCREVLGVAEPTVGLLSIGEEPGKGRPQVVEAHGLLAADLGLAFYGNVEGRDLLNSTVDVVVTDGFTGNVALKASEGAAKAVLALLKQAVAQSARAKVGALLLKPDLVRIRAALDPEEYGAMHLLGMNRPMLIGHGSSGARGAENAVRYAARAVSGHLVEAIAARLGERPPVSAGADAAPSAAADQLF